MAELYERHASLLRAATEVSTYDDEVRVFWRGIVERFIEATAADLRGERSRGGVPRGLEPQSTAESLVWMAERCCYVYPRERRALGSRARRVTRGDLDGRALPSAGAARRGPRPGALAKDPSAGERLG